MGIGSVVSQPGELQNIRTSEMSEAASEKVRVQDVRIHEDPVPAAVTHEVPEAVYPERKNTVLEDISITFNRQEDFEYIGKDRDIHGLDAEKAINDMKRDQVLQQYQYFVGSSDNLHEAEAPDGMVIRKL